MNWFSSSGFLKAAVESATNLTKSLIQDEFVEDSDADDSPAVSRLKQSPSLLTEDEEEVGITPQLIEFVHNVLLYPKTFTDFPLDAHIKVRTKLGDKLVTTPGAKKPTDQNEEAPQLNKSSNSNPSTPTAKIPNSLLLPLSPILDLIQTNENADSTATQPEQSPRIQELEEYFESLWREDLNNSLESLEQHPNYIDPEKDNYFVTDISFEDFVKGKVTSYPPSPKKLSPRPKNEKSIPSKAAKVIRSLTSSLLDESTEIPSTPLNTSANADASFSTPQPSIVQQQQEESVSTLPSTQESENFTPQPQEPTDTTKLTEPIELTESTPTEPTQPTEPTELIETTPTELTEPIELTESTQPMEPTEPTETTLPTELIDSTKQPEQTQEINTTPQTNESLQEIISSLMEDTTSTHELSVPSQPPSSLTAEQDDDSFMNWQ